MSGDPIELDVSLEHRALAAGGRARTHLVVRVGGDVAMAVEAARPRLRLVFVLDTSGSMNGPPLEAVAESVAEMVGLLRDEDEVGLVTFAEEAATVAEVRPLGGGHRVTLQRRARRMRANGATNVEAGLRRAVELLGARETHTRHAVVLLSDGIPNRGTASPEGLRALTSSFRPDVGVSCLGYGAHHAEEALAAVADGGAGEYHFVETPGAAADTFARVLGAQGDVVADAIELLLRPADGTEIEGFLGGAPSRVTSAGLRGALPDARAGVSKVRVVPLDVDVAAGPGAQTVGVVRVIYRAAGEAEVRTREVEVEVAREATSALDEPAHHAVLLAHAEEARSQARALADRGAFDGAAASLRQMIARIEAAPGYAANDGSLLSEALEQMVDEAVVLEQRPSMESYRAYKREWMGMDMHAGGAHAGDHAVHGAQAAALKARGAAHLPPASLVVGKNGEVPRVVPLRGELTIGRTLSNDLQLPFCNLSKRHARIVPGPDGWVLVDLKSTNGTYVNGERIAAPRPLSEGDKIYIGNVVLELRLDSGS
ncbi:MAG: FHA domain-containing protein [Myxococcota bacterium]|nr:FHA domain-containing protein [Myxococcota bacterium]